MRKKPFLLFLCASLFLYFPVEFFLRLWGQGMAHVESFDVLLSVILPLVLIAGLLRVTKAGWYTLVAVIALWGIRDLYIYYSKHGQSLTPLFVHLVIYITSLSYFINPRVRHLYFDARLRWWRTKPRYETHLPFVLRSRSEWHYPILGNISEGGCFVETPHAFELNDKVEITIPLPIPLNLSVIKTMAEIRWVSRNPLRLGIGVQFENLTPPTTKALKQFVHKRL